MGEFTKALATALQDAFAPVARLGSPLREQRGSRTKTCWARRTCPPCRPNARSRRSPGRSGCLLVFPQAVSTPLAEMFARSPSATKLDPNWTRKMEQGVTKAPLTLTAILDEFEMRLGDVAGLQVGGAAAAEQYRRGRHPHRMRRAQRLHPQAGRAWRALRARSPPTSSRTIPTPAELKSDPSIKPNEKKASKHGSHNQHQLGSRRRRRSCRAPAGLTPNLDAILSIPVNVQVHARHGQVPRGRRRLSRTRPRRRHNAGPEGRRAGERARQSTNRPRAAKKSSSTRTIRNSASP